jgi:flagellar biosynthesis protein FlhG
MLGQAERLVELKHLFANEREASDSKNVFAFTSGKGGTGKTLLSLNIAWELSRMGKKVVYADLDFNLANAHLMLDINPVNTLSDYFTHRKLLKDIIHHYSDGFDLIFGDSGKTGFPEVTDISVKSLISELKNENYDIIILDLSAGAGKNITDILSYADFAIIIATTEPTSVMDAYALSKLIKYEKLKCGQYVIMNKCRGKEDGEYAFNNLNSAISHFLNSSISLLNCVNYSNEAYESVFSQKLISMNGKSAPVTAQLQKAGAGIAEIAQLANNRQHHIKNL